MIFSPTVDEYLDRYIDEYLDRYIDGYMYRQICIYLDGGSDISEYGRDGKIQRDSGQASVTLSKNDF